MTSKLLLVTLTFLCLGLIYESTGPASNESNLCLEEGLEVKIVMVTSIREKTGLYNVTIFRNDGSEEQNKMTLSESNKLILDLISP